MGGGGPWLRRGDGDARRLGECVHYREAWDGRVVAANHRHKFGLGAADQVVGWLQEPVSIRRAGAASRVL